MLEPPRRKGGTPHETYDPLSDRGCPRHGNRGRGRAPPRAGRGARPATERSHAWSLVSQNAISVGRPPASSEVLHGLVHAAIYDAVVAVEGEYEPFAVSLRRRGPTSVDAAVAATARGVLVVRVPGQAAMVEAAYTAFLDGIPDGPRKTNGIRLGRAVAGAYLGAEGRRRLRQRRAVGAAAARAGHLRAHSTGEHAGRRQAQAGSAADVRRPVALPAGWPGLTDEPQLHPGLQRGQGARPGGQHRANPGADGDLALLDGAHDGSVEPEHPQPRPRPPTWTRWRPRG